jgi:3,4-dihydroxy 2-butanone 4-phosphate synthase/GTP cyclohydrolase II
VADAQWIARLVARNRLKVVSISSIAAYRRAHEPVIRPVVSAMLPTLLGEFLATGFTDRVSGTHHLGLVRGDVAGDEPPLVAIEFECRLGRALRAVGCQCRSRQDDAMARINREGRGVLLQLSRSAGPGLAESAFASCSAYLADDGAEQPQQQYAPPPWSAVEIASDMLLALGLSRLRLLSSLSVSDEAFRERGLEVVERVTPRGGHGRSVTTAPR